MKSKSKLIKSIFLAIVTFFTVGSFLAASGIFCMKNTLARLGCRMDSDRLVMVTIGISILVAWIYYER